MRSTHGKGRQTSSPHGIPALHIAFASDHAAIALKAKLVDGARDAGHDVTDLGPQDEGSVDYPDYAHLLAAALADCRLRRLAPFSSRRWARWTTRSRMASPRVMSPKVS